MSQSWDAIVVGGGAAGYYGAISCAEALRAQGRRKPRVLILERAPRVLQKVRISGGGRCNVTHACWAPKEMASRYPRGNKVWLDCAQSCFVRCSAQPRPCTAAPRSPTERGT